MDGRVVWWADFRSPGDAPENFRTDPVGTEFHEAVMDWMRSLGLDPTRLLPAVAVVQWRGGLELHADQAVGDRPGVDRSDPLRPDCVLTERVIIRVEPDSWPARPVEVAA